MELTESTRKVSWFLVINEKCFDENINYENMYNLVDSLKPTYAIWNKEKGDTGNVHIHLYLEFSSAKTMKRLKKVFGNAHFEPRLGNPTEARNYIIKPEGMEFGGEEKSHTLIEPYVEYGDFEPFKDIKARPGDKKNKKSDNEKIFEYVEQFNCIDDILEIDPCLVTRHRRNLEELFYKKKFDKFKESKCKIDVSETGDEVISVDRKVYYLYGNSRSGKTYGIKKKFGSKNVSILNNIVSPMKYDDYELTDVMVLDEFYGQMTLSECLNLLDVYVTNLPSRYANKPNLASHIMLTSNLPFDELYQYAKYDTPTKYKAFCMRFTGGIWEMYRCQNNERIICNRTSKFIKDRYILDMVQAPPVSINNDSVVLVPEEVFDDIKQFDMRLQARQCY